MTHQQTRNDQQLNNSVLRFPKGFLWGTATSSYQVEGNNIHSDWWEWEHQTINRQQSTDNKKRVGLKSIHTARPEERELFLSGRGVDHYARFEEDFDLVESLHNNAHRLSLEWARLEPHEGVFDQREIEHYRQVLLALRKRKMKIMVTLHHFTNPSWFAKKGGWAKRKNIAYFLHYVERVVKEYCDLVDFWITINEPNVYVQMSYMGGWKVQSWPPEEKNIPKGMWAFLNMAYAHRRVYEMIHCRDQGSQKACVGFAQNFASYATIHKHNLYDLFIVFLADTIANHSFLLLTKKYHDFLGMNYYFRTRFMRRGNSMVPQIVDVSEQGRERSDTGFEIYPHGIYSCLMDLRDYGLPIYITENGVAAHDDSLRVRFLVSYIQEIYYSIRAGVPVKGYFHWSLLDNYEWDLGYTQQFGLIAVDRRTGNRFPKPSFSVYKRICEANGIPHDLLAYVEK